MTDTPTLSIVVVNWNTRELLLQLLRRLFDAPRLPFEVLVVDNQSADGSAEAAANTFPQAIVLPQPRSVRWAYCWHGTPAFSHSAMKRAALSALVL